MQLNAGGHPASIAARLRAAALVLLAAGAPTVAHAQAAAPSWQLDASTLYYSEHSRTQIVEPVARISRLFTGGTTLSALLALDVMTGASPSGAQPSGTVQTTTSASGATTTRSANEIPTAAFRDFRSALDLSWGQPIGPLTLTTSGHASRERDYRSLGIHEQGSLDLMHHLTTVTFGGGVNQDEVRPIGGVRVGLADGSLFEREGVRDKRVTDGMVGVSRVLTRRWLVGVNGARTHEVGYLTEPYKVVSLIDAAGSPSADSSLTERRPGKRDRSSVLASSVYHLDKDVLYLSYRYYWDDWGVRSNTVDLKYRNELPEHDWLQPHVRFYRQAAADFFVFGLPLALPVAARPRHATSDFRLGPLSTLTLGLTYGFRWPDVAGDFTVRGEYLRQWGDGRPANAVGVQRGIDLFPTEDVLTIMAGYSLPL